MMKHSAANLALPAEKIFRKVAGSGLNQFNDFKGAIQKSAEGLGDANHLGQKWGVNPQDAMLVAVECMQIAFTVVSAQLAAVHDKRVMFEQEMNSGAATFEMPADKESRKLTEEELAINTFAQLTVHQPYPIKEYTSLQESTLKEKNGALFYSVLPFYKLSFQAASHRLHASASGLDKAREAIALFNTAGLSLMMKKVADQFYETNDLFVAAEGMWQQANYLNALRAPRLITVSLVNLLWNLQHPVDPDTGFELSLRTCVTLCDNVAAYLDLLLDPKQSPYLKKNQMLYEFIQTIQRHNKRLWIAYAEEQLHELNISELSNSAHQTLRFMDQSMFRLIYQTTETVKKLNQPNKESANRLVLIINDLNDFVQNNSTWGELFRVFDTAIPAQIPYLNSPPKTVMDMLIIFCHLSPKDKRQLMLNLKANQCGRLVQLLVAFNVDFLIPIDRISEHELMPKGVSGFIIHLFSYFFPRKHKHITALTARRLIPFISLLIEDYGLDLSGNKQVRDINKLAHRADGYFRWTLRPFLGSGVSESLDYDRLPEYQFRLTQMTRLLDEISILIEYNRSFLLNTTIKQILLRCLENIKKECKLVEQRIQQARLQLNTEYTEENTDHGLKCTLNDMAAHLIKNLDEFIAVMNDVEGVINNPNFMKNEKMLVIDRMNLIDELYREVFEEESGIGALVQAMLAQTETSLIPPELGVHGFNPLAPVVVPSNQVMALRRLVQECYDSLSWPSRFGHKGELLHQLIRRIERQPEFTPALVNHVIHELVRVTSSYNVTFFVHEAYGNTRSAKTLIAAIKDPALNQVLPLASIVMGDPHVDFAQLRDIHILQQLRALRVELRSEESITPNMVLQPFPI